MEAQLTSKGSTSHGFTLLELLVVLVILGVILSMASLKLNHGGRRDLVDNAATRLSHVTRLLANEAVYRGRPYGIDLGQDRYTLKSYAVDGWVTAADGDLATEELLPEGLVLLDERGGSFKLAARNGTPDLVLMPSGERTLPVIELSDELSVARTRLNPSGDLQLFRLEHATP